MPGAPKRKQHPQPGAPHAPPARPRVRPAGVVGSTAGIPEVVEMLARETPAGVGDRAAMTPGKDGTDRSYDS